MRKTTEPAADGSALNFPATVAASFSFLAGLGFTLYESSATLVQYGGKNMIASVFHGRRSHCIGFEVVRNGERYSLLDIMLIVDSNAGMSYRQFIARTPEATARGVARLAEDVRRYAMRALRDDPALFDALRDLRARRPHELALETRVASVRPKADDSFRAGRYAEAAALYEQMESHLTAVEKTRLEIARRRANKEA